MFKFNFRQPDKDENPINPIAEAIGGLMSKIKTRCLIEGCRYGIEGVDEKPKDHCIYCGGSAMPITNDFYKEDPLAKKQTEGYRAYYAWTAVGAVGGVKPCEDQTFCAWCRRSQTEIKASGEKLNNHIEKHANEDQKVKLDLLDELIAHFDKNHEYSNQINFDYRHAIQVLHGFKSMVKRGIR